MQRQFLTPRTDQGPAMARKDLSASPGQAIIGRIALEYAIDRDVHGMLIREIDRAVAVEREACAKIAEHVDGDFERDTDARTVDATRRGIAAAVRARFNP